MLIRQTGAGRGYDNPYSLLMDGAAHYLSRTAGAPTSRRQVSILIMARRSRVGVADALYCGYSSGTTYTNIYFDTTGRLCIESYDSNSLMLQKYSTRRFRDNGKPYAIRVTFDTPNAAAGSRVTASVWGAEITAWDTSTNPAQNYDTHINESGVAQYIGFFPSATYLGGGLGEVIVADGQVLTDSAWLRLDPVTGQYVRRNYAGSYGDEGSRLRYGDATSTTTLGYDDSGKGNHWTLNNMATTDRLTDSPANCHAILSAIDPPTNTTISEGGLAASIGSGKGAVRATQPSPGGKRMFEVTGAAFTQSGGIKIGFSLASFALSVASDLGFGTDGFGVRANGASTDYFQYGGSSSNLSADFTLSTDVCGVAVNFDNGDVAIYKNGASVFSTNIPAIVGQSWFPTVANETGGTTKAFSVNFGQKAFAYPISGYEAIGTAAIARPTYKKGSLGFNADKQPGSAIEASIAALRSGWAAYIEEFKNLSNSQSWKVRYSDNTAKMLGYDSGFTTGKVDFTAPTSGDQYVGYVTRVGQAFGVFTAEVSHTNLTPTTVAHGLGAARKVADARRTDADGPWYYSHPDLTAGKLLYLDGTAGETTDSSITVDGTNVTLAAALPSGTYRVTVKAEVSGLRKFGKAKGSNSVDGWLAWCDFRPARFAGKRSDAASSAGRFIWDMARSPSNEVLKRLFSNLPDAEYDNNTLAVDLVSGAAKARAAHADQNGTGDYVWEAEASVAFKYANAA